MKKSKLTVGLVTTFIGALALTACNETPKVTKKDDVIIDFVGYNGDTDQIEIRTDIYNEMSHTDEGTKLYYDAILETLIRYEYPIMSASEKYQGQFKKSFAQLESEADDQVTAARQTARDNASQNGTTESEEWDKILESHNCKDEKELKQYYLYNLEKTELTDWFTKQNITDLKDQYIGVSKEWKPVAPKIENVDPVFPYHILHVLVTLSADKADYIRGTISSTEAHNLWAVVRNLIDGQYSFQEVAMNKSEDTGSKDKYGDVEIMSTKTSFYNEFKLGIYAYDALLSGVNTSNENTKNIYNAMGLSDTAEIVTQITKENGEKKESVRTLVSDEMIKNVKTPIAYTTIPTVPYEVFKRIGDNYDKEKIDLFTPEAGDVALPRNVLYNQFLNFHSPFLVTDEDIEMNGDVAVNVTSHNFVNPAKPAENDLKLASTNFISMDLPTTAGGTTTKKVLADKQGNVVIGVRSEAGIHFMVMRKSVFEETNKAVDKETTSLQDYYTTLIPGEEGYPEGKETFVNMVKTDDNSYYEKRADTIKNEIQSSSTFDAAYDYRLYERLMTEAGTKVKFFDYEEGKGSQIQKDIEEYIKLLRETKHNGDVDSINEAWRSYLMMLRYQNTVRSFENTMIPTTCAFRFDSAHKADFEEGGKCYVEKK